jgi:predicted anti-sigma-YlaC factor YlaD
MSEACPHSFDERLLSGHLDGELTQAEAQQVRIHMEDCESCRALFDQLKLMREASMSTPFATPDDEQWDERPQAGASRLFRGTGWFFLMAWLAASLGLALWCFITEPGDPLLKLLVFSGALGIGLLFLSVLVDRLRSAKTDRYRRVKK